MSTLDIMCEWRLGERADTEMLLQCLINLATWCPAAAQTEAYQALSEVVLDMRQREDDALPDLPSIP